MILIVKLFGEQGISPNILTSLPTPALSGSGSIIYKIILGIISALVLKAPL